MYKIDKYPSYIWEISVFSSILRLTDFIVKKQAERHRPEVRQFCWNSKVKEKPKSVKFWLVFMMVVTQAKSVNLSQCHPLSTFDVYLLSWNLILFNNKKEKKSFFQEIVNCVWIGWIRPGSGDIKIIADSILANPNTSNRISSKYGTDSLVFCFVAKWSSISARLRFTSKVDGERHYDSFTPTCLSKNHHKNLHHFFTDILKDIFFLLQMHKLVKNLNFSKLPLEWP